MAVIRLSMHAYYRPAGDCACTAKTLDEAVQDLGAVENIVRDFGDANPTMLSWRSLAGVIAHLAADPVRSRTLIGEEIRRGANPLRCCATSPGIDRDRRTVAWSTPGSHHRVAEHRGIARTGARFTPAWAAGFGTQISASRPALNWESLWTWRIGAEPPERKLTSGRSWRATTRSVLTGVGSLTPTELQGRPTRTAGHLEQWDRGADVRIAKHAWHGTCAISTASSQIESRDQLLTLIND